MRVFFFLMRVSNAKVDLRREMLQRQVWWDMDVDMAASPKSFLLRQQDELPGRRHSWNALELALNAGLKAYSQ